MIKGRESIVILRRVFEGEEDAYGNALPSNVEITVKSVLIGWGATADTVTTISETINNAATLYFSKDIELKNGDRFRFPDGSVWVKNGATISWSTPVGFRVKTRQVVEVTRTEG